MTDLVIDATPATAPIPADLGRLLRPSGHYRHPRDVLADLNLSVGEKRAILASWASDACAVDSTPMLRALPGCAPVTFDDVMDALAELDPTHEQDQAARPIRRATRLRLRPLFRARRGTTIPGCPTS